MSGLSFISTAEGSSTNLNALIYVLALGFDGQWPGPQGNFTPRVLTNDSIRLCEFDGWLEAGSINYTSGTVDQCKAQHCFVGFYVGPSPGGGRVDFKQNHLTQNFEASLQACGTPNFWSAPAQPASLALNVSSNRFEKLVHEEWVTAPERLTSFRYCALSI